jgi:hypothetical protein
VTIDKRGSSGFVDQGVDIFDLPLDRIVLGVPTGPPAPTVIAVNREVLREKLGELRRRCTGSLPCSSTASSTSTRSGTSTVR